MKLSILTPSKKIVSEVEVSEVFAPGIEGEIEILPQYANFLTELEAGVVRWKTPTGWGVASVSYGWLEVFEERISILADVGELASDIDEERSKKAESIAFKKISEGGMDDREQRKYELKLQRAISRMKAKQTAN